MTSTGNALIDKSLSRLEASASAFGLEREKFLSSLPVARPCPRHPEFQQRRDDRESWINQRPMFVRCDLCLAELQQQRQTDRLQRIGVPLNLCGATFGNWMPDDEQAEANLSKVHEFARIKRGFLILLGDLGTGKSHLGVAVLRTFPSGLFIKHVELLQAVYVADLPRPRSH